MKKIDIEKVPVSSGSRYPGALAAPCLNKLRRRLGDILILPFADRFVWWYEPGLLHSRYYGNHGGLTREELISVIGVVDSL